MNDRECTEFLQWALPQLGLRWAGFRKVRHLVCKRLGKRLRELGLADPAHYRAMLERDAAERLAFDGLCRIPVSRFYRDRGIFDALRDKVLPRLAQEASARGQQQLRAWSAGCASGEEPYTLRVLWELAIRERFPEIELHVVATDADRGMLQRAQAGCYGSSSLSDLPKGWLALAFEHRGGLHCLRDAFRGNTKFVQQDIRTAMPDGAFDLILCRNLVFTYFEPALQRIVAARIIDRLQLCGVMVVGIHEKLPAGLDDLHPLSAMPGLYEKTAHAPG